MMRLQNVLRGDGLKSRMIFGVFRVLHGHRAPDVMRTLMYRPSFFGAHQNAHSQAVMRGPSEWSVWERELFAAFVSLQNQCPY